MVWLCHCRCRSKQRAQLASIRRLATYGKFWLRGGLERSSSGPPSRPYSPYCLEEGEFSEVRPFNDSCTFGTPDSRTTLETCLFTLLDVSWLLQRSLVPERTTLLRRDERSLWRSDRWWGVPRGGRWADVGAASGARDDPHGAKRRGGLHLRRPGGDLRCVAGARGHRNVGRIRACAPYGGDRGQRACRDLLARPSAPRTRRATPPGALPILRRRGGQRRVAPDGAG